MPEEEYPTCHHGYYPYCPRCPHGGEYISETEEEFYRIDGVCSTVWYCLLDEQTDAPSP